MTSDGCVMTLDGCVMTSDGCVMTLDGCVVTSDDGGAVWHVSGMTLGSGMMTWMP